MANWTKTGIDMGVGLVAGAADQLIQNYDEKNRRTQVAAGKTLSLWKEIGTWFNYGVPVLAVIGVATDMIKGEWATRAVIAGTQLAGRKVVYMATKAQQSAPWRPAGTPGGEAPRHQTQKPGFEKAGII